MKNVRYPRLRKLAPAAVAGTVLLAGFAHAQEVTLRSSDGTVNMTGDFVAFEDNAYIIATALGDLRVAANRVSCIGDACPDLSIKEADIVISGADAIGIGLMPLLLEGYAGSLDAAAELVNLANSDTVVAELTADQGYGDALASFLVAPSSSNESFQALTESAIQIAMSSRRILPDEARSLRDAGAGNMISPDQEHILAVDSLVVITHPDNPVDTLTTEQLRGMYSGAISNWSEVGGDDMPISFVVHEEGSGERNVFEDRIFGDIDFTLGSQAVLADSNGQVAELVNADPAAIGVVAFAFQRGANALSVINECGIRMEPDAFSARTEEYALQRRLFLYSRADNASPQQTDFLEFATSSAADGLIGKAGFIGFGVARKEQLLNEGRALSLLASDADPYEGQFMREMLSRMVEYDRLSTTFRFATGSARLDERGRIDMARLIDYLEGQPDGSEVLLVGFTDDVGQFDGNRTLSEGRAAQILGEIQTAGGSRVDNLVFNSIGYGEIAPSGCNIDQEGRRINRRVEVWIKAPE